ncbi:MAG: serine/threonine protein phosphatase [Rhodospirillales bacterium]|nr:serine/threonine protein phosphatase [Rhodospirillales bacterium]
MHPSPGRLPEGQRVYAIGDIHGLDERLRTLHALIAGDMRARPVGAAVVVHLGDYIDRGPDSARVLARLAGLRRIGPARVFSLMGNHERTFLDALAGDAPAATDFLHQGGGETLASFDIAPEVPAAEWSARIAPAVLAFLRGLLPAYRAGTYFFAHAGIRPGITLEQQSVRDLVSIRQPFLASEADLGAVVVHGHTPVPAPVIGRNRIGIDTGAVLGGPLTAAILEGGTVGFLAA